jgi:hypothetical protein
MTQLLADKGLAASRLLEYEGQLTGTTQKIETVLLVL